MKKSLLLICSASLFAAANIMAQPTLTASGINPAVGDQYNISYTQYVSPGSAGASQTWNLATMTVTSTATQTAVTVGSTSQGSQFPGATVAIAVPNNNYGYYNASATALQFMGSVSNGTIVIGYQNPEDQMHYPFNYTNTYSDNFSSSYSISGNNAYRAGTITVTADGWG